MEFKQYLKITKKHKGLFLSLWGLTVTVVALVFFFHPWQKGYESSFSFDISRLGSAELELLEEDYQYNQYYKLEANDMFAETINRWLMDPAMTGEILKEAKVAADFNSIKNSSKFFKAERLAPGFVQVYFSAESPTQAKEIFAASRNVLSRKVELLNEEAQELDWFYLIFSDVVIMERSFEKMPFVLAGLFGGLLVAIFGVLFKYYWLEE